MIGSGLKKLALENGMTVSNGVAYGSLKGYAATMFEGTGFKSIVFTICFADPAKKAEFMDTVSAVGDKNLYKQFRINGLSFAPAAIRFNFHDTIGTMKKIRAFIDWIIPLLQNYGASTVNQCPDCGCEITDGCWVMVNGVCYHVHEACAEKIAREVESGNEQEKQERTGNYFTGAVGAFLGAALGALVWAIVLLLGYVASIVGFVIGWLSEKGYTLLKGKVGKAKVVILILAVIFGVLAGTLAADVFTLVDMINAGELPGAVYGDIPYIILITLEDSPEYLRGMLSNVGLGLLFAGLGVFGMMRRAGREAAGTKFLKLK